MKIKKRNIIKNTKARIIPYTVMIMLIMVAISGIFLNYGDVVKADDPEVFILWGITDSHGAMDWDDDVSVTGGVWSGAMIDETTSHIDFAINSGDILLDGGSSATMSTYINSTHDCIVDGNMQTTFWDLPANERMWGFCMGNHEDNNGGCTEAAKGLGLDPSLSWYDTDVTMGQAYNYTVQRGNLLFIFMGGNRSDPTDYAYGIETEGDFDWFEEQVLWADEHQVNVFVVAHVGLWNGSTSYTKTDGVYKWHDTFYNVSSAKWEACIEHLDYARSWKDYNYFVESETSPPLVAKYIRELIDTTGNVNMWFSGHVHVPADATVPPPHEHGGWDTILGVERDIQKAPTNVSDCYITHVQLSGVGPYNWDFSFSRLMHFTEGSKDVLFRSFDHNVNEYGSDVGQWNSSHQDITITNALKYPYNPYWEAVVILSIDGLMDGSTIFDLTPIIEWSDIEAEYYQLQVSEDEEFNSLFINLNDINETNYPLHYDESEGIVSFDLPVSLSHGKTYYFRVRGEEE